MESAAAVYLGLLHYPVYNKRREVVASAVTNLDIHDLSRLAATFDLPRFYVITPLKDQRVLARRIVSHWTEGRGGQVNPDRKSALERVWVTETLVSACEDIRGRTGVHPTVVLTGASPQGPVVSFERMRGLLMRPEPFLLVFGTAWGLAVERISSGESLLLAPIRGRAGYNHLSVRSAASIVLDRLMSSGR